ncbi:MAG: hypothetical protein KJ573_14935 [Proteobacteria bacterium]|nr:hypothetical protein [Desulfobacterales bacterium]MBL7101377.1 hypothetical protein [Desulfobacteraceae bacterium]MBU0735899.1 hypothetical protein [Pseudomonadota bacterium]MBL7172508.1 hypothetical protein [Desulfobacteraceae bacterium]MBU0989240.1 hypothetical protein [Pseudomonadota bacterium]
MVEKVFGNRANFYQTLLNRIEKADPNKIVRDNGKLLKEDYRNWIRTSFLSDFKQLVSSELSALNQRMNQMGITRDLTVKGCDGFEWYQARWLSVTLGTNK